MSATMEHSPEKVLLATLHKVGTNVRLMDDFELAKVFNNAATQYGGPFKPFAWHRHYHVSEALSEALQVLDHAGSIVRENAAQTYFRASAHTAGPYGENVFQSLSPDEQKLVEMVAADIKQTFEAQNEPAQAN